MSLLFQRARRRAAPAATPEPIRHEAPVCLQWGLDMRPVGCGVIVADNRGHAENMNAGSTDLKNRPVDSVVFRQLDAGGTPVTDWAKP